MAKAKKELTKKTKKTKKTTPATQATTKTATKATSKAAAKPVAKSAKKVEPKVKLAIETKKGDKKSKVLEVKAEILTEGQTNEEDEEELEAAQAQASASGLAMAAATAGAETTAGSLKNFRHHPDIENFYRFIYENDLRYEALDIIAVMASQRANIRANKAAKAKTN